jgi:hypothetical protein
MDDEIDLAPALLQPVEDGVERGHVGDVAMADEVRAEFLGQRLDALLEGIALIGERELGALGGAGLRDAPGDGPLLAMPMIRPRLPAIPRTASARSTGSSTCRSRPSTR